MMQHDPFQALELKSTDLWWTPPEVVEIVRMLFPAGYLDAFGCNGSPLTEHAVSYWSEEFSFGHHLESLEDPDRPGDLACVANPPWSRGWIKTAVMVMRMRGFDRRALIAPLALETAWARDFDPIHLLVPRGRLRYTLPDGSRPGSPRTSSGVYVRGSVLEEVGWRRAFLQKRLMADGWEVWKK